MDSIRIIEIKKEDNAQIAAVIREVFLFQMIIQNRELPLQISNWILCLNLMINLEQYIL